MTTAPLLSVRDLVVEFPTRRGTLRAIDEVSFDIAEGEVLGMVGESGAGKSLIGAAIIGLLEPPGRIAGGEIVLRGERIDTLAAEPMRRIRGKRIGMVFQDPLTSLNPLYTVAQQLIETIRTHIDASEREARERAIALLDRVGIPAARRRIDDYPHHFSGGMRQRVVIAPQIIDVLKEICAERGASVMLITHDMGVIAETADRVAVLYAGRLAEIGPVRDVIQNAEHPYTQGLMGSIPTLTQTTTRLVQIPGAMPRLDAIPKGCAFNPRCPHVMDRCRTDRPGLVARGGRREVSCWLYEAGGKEARHG